MVSLTVADFEQHDFYLRANIETKGSNIYINLTDEQLNVINYLIDKIDRDFVYNPKIRVDITEMANAICGSKSKKSCTDIYDTLDRLKLIPSICCFQGRYDRGIVKHVYILECVTDLEYLILDEENEIYCDVQFSKEMAEFIIARFFPYAIKYRKSYIGNENSET